LGERIAIVLFNLGGPDSLKAVEPFLRNLFSDPAIIALPAPFRLPLGRFIAWRRAPVARGIYGKIGGRSPILEETRAQAAALDSVLAGRRLIAKSFVVMRYWRPFARETVEAVKAWQPDQIVLLPLYPQFSTTTSDSSFVDWDRAAKLRGLNGPAARICCYPALNGFVRAEANLIQEALTRRKPGVVYRLLLSAHGLPKRTITRGDPYQWQVEKTARAIVDALGIEGLDWSVCYQSRVGPLEWIGPATDAEIRHAGAEGKGLIVAPIAFVSEHSETLVELDIEYAHLAKGSGVVDYLRVSTVGTAPDFIEGLADLVMKAATGEGTINGSGGRLCPAGLRCCVYEGI
jgi:protoporphyrin/coproporphyrin ferrochelatase